MGRKTQITRDMILQAAYELLDTQGAAGVNIKTIAAKLGCSTQPISWHFGDMKELRKELYIYSSRVLWADMPELLAGKTGHEAFFETGKQYISVAYDHPKVFRFLCVDEHDFLPVQTNILEMLGDPAVNTMLAKELGLSLEAVTNAVDDIVIYAHGLALLFMWDGFKTDKETAFNMIYEMGCDRFNRIGIDLKSL